MPILTVESGPQKGHELVVRPPGPVFFGRDLEADFPLFDRKASRRHFRIDFCNEGYRLADLDSRFGTFVNGARVRTARLSHGDRIAAGGTALVFRVDRPGDPLVGRDVGAYRVLEAVGTGGMGAVYRAVQTSLQRVVALKVLAEPLARDEEFCRQFVEEARAAAEIAHPNVVRVYDVDWKGGLLFYAMEFMARGSVRDLTRYRGPLPFEDALRIAVEAACGLEFAHFKGIVHRDVKPSNLLIHETGAVKIADLGIALRIDRGSAGASPGGLSGSPHYLSPEQALGREIDPRSDIYSLGATLFEMLTGRPPFVRETARDLLLAHVRDDPPDLRSLRPEAPAVLAALVKIALEKRPENRPQSAAVFGQMLSDVRRQILGSPPPRPASPIRRWSRRAFQWSLVGLWALIGIGAGHALRHVERKVRERRRRMERVRQIVAEAKRLLDAGDVRGARSRFAEISRIQCHPEDWEALRPEIDRVEDALKAAEARARAEGGLN
ncbi:MAG: protein kinase domain-containing protein [Planctomycetota bacterium]